MQSTIIDSLGIVVACVVVAILAGAGFLLRPGRRRHRHRKQHSRRPKIDLFAAKETEQGPTSDA